MIKGGFSEATALDSRFDIVILSHVFEHMVDLDSALVDLRRLLQPGGVVYIEVPGVLSIHRRPVYRFDWVAYFTHAHIYHFCLATLDNVLSSHGFELISGNEEVEALFRCLDAPDATPVLKDLPETAAFLQGYLAMLATERAWNRGSPDSTLNRIDELTRELHKAKAVVAYYDEKRRSIGWLFRQMVRSAVPGLDGYLRRRERGR
jgi:SAM-dependent methyltransferase